MKLLLTFLLSFVFCTAFADAPAADESVSNNDSADTTPLSPLHVSIPFMGDMPGNDIEHPLVNVIRQWGHETGREITIERFPFKRSLMMAATGEVDFHFPMIKDHDATDEGLPFGYSETTIFTVNFVLYTRSGETLDLDNLHNYRMATFGGHGKLFPFPTSEDNTIESSLRKLDSGRIDGFIFADSGADPVLFELGLMGIQRQLYKVYDVHAVISHRAKKGPVDQFITEATQNMDRNILGLAQVDQPYHDWQMGDGSVPALVQSEK
jgi:polar amino acid transport system substrate-binding protein